MNKTLILAVTKVEGVPKVPAVVGANVPRCVQREITAEDWKGNKLVFLDDGDMTPINQLVRVEIHTDDQEVT